MQTNIASKRTTTEIANEIKALKKLRNKVPSTTYFGDDNRAAIDAQIRVIEENMTLDDIHDEWEDDDFLLGNADDALKWLREDADPVSGCWAHLVEAQAELATV
jgi:hypothetical protein